MGGLVGKRYPWGDEIDKAKAHYDRWNDGKGTTKAVGNYAENGYGLYEMVGNVWEWCLDGFDGHYYSRSPEKNPLAGHTSTKELIKGYKGIGTDRMLRGGACTVERAICAWRPATTTGRDLGTASGFVVLCRDRINYF